MNRLRRCGREGFSETWPGRETPEMNSFPSADEKGATGVREYAVSFAPLLCLLCCACPIIGLAINE
jgi:hypothetical protein